MPILIGLDGVQKMSKSLGNYIGISEPPGEIYGKAMSLADELMIDYFKLTTGLDLEEINNIEEGLNNGELHPRDVKMKLARELAAMYHGEEAALEAEKEFQKVFQQKELPSEMPVVEVRGNNIWIVKLLTESGLVSTNSEARRLLKQGAVKVNGNKINNADDEISVEEGNVIQVGRRKFARIKLIN